MIDYILKISIDRACPITIVYQQGRKISQRDIRVFETKEDYVKAFCYLRGQIRVFKKENILSASFSCYSRSNNIDTAEIMAVKEFARFEMDEMEYACTAM